MSLPRRATLVAALSACALGLPLRPAWAKREVDEGEYLIQRARYGTARRHIDVTQRLRELAQRDLRVSVDNELFGQDPDPGALKTLRLYVQDRQGREQILEVPEHGLLDGRRFIGWAGGGWGQGQGGDWGDGAALGGRDAYRILEARYGTAERHIDVTPRLRELAQQDERVRITNGLFGADPDPGRVKVLRLYTQDRQGQSRVFEYREGALIDGSLFTGWGGGRWGQQGAWQGGWDHHEGPSRPARADDDGQYRILQAHYGTPRRFSDVTARLRDLARQDRRFRVSNDTLGGDPDPGQPKWLRLYTQDRQGRERLFEYAEGGVVDGAEFIGWSGGAWGQGGWRGGWGPGGEAGRLDILSATYGAGRREVDVTERLQRWVQHGALQVRADNELAGIDPAPGTPKRLRVRYRVEGRTRDTEVREGEVLRLP